MLFQKLSEMVQRAKDLQAWSNLDTLEVDMVVSLVAEVLSILVALKWADIKSSQQLHASIADLYKNLNDEDRFVHSFGRIAKANPLWIHPQTLLLRLGCKI